MRKFCYKCEKSVPQNHKCGTNSPTRKTKSVNSHRRFQKLRLDIIVRDGGECVQCRVMKGISTREEPNRPLQVHHIKGQAQFPHLAWEPTNLITLCKDCHDEYDKGNIHQLKFDWTPPPLYDVKIYI